MAPSSLIFKDIKLNKLQTKTTGFLVFTLFTDRNCDKIIGNSKVPIQ